MHHGSAHMRKIFESYLKKTKSDSAVYMLTFFTLTGLLQVYITPFNPIKNRFGVCMGEGN